MNLPALLAKARGSSFHRWRLNFMLPWVIPFNRPHGFKVVPLPTGGMSVIIPYWRINHNHVKGLHACALATAAEMCSGLSVLELVDPKKYRLIMRELHMSYHYQAKGRTTASCTPTLREIQEQVVEPLRTTETIDHASTVVLHDAGGRHIATGTITWQVKPWSAVRTKV